VLLLEAKMWRQRLRCGSAVLCGVLVAALAACGSDKSTGTPAVGSVEITPESPSVAVGSTTQLTAVVKDTKGNVMEGTGVEWSSSNSDVASVNDDGVVTGVAAGTVTITAKAGSVPGTTTVTVTDIPVASITVTPTSADLVVGDSQPITAVLEDADGNTLTGRTVTWTSDNAAATVSAAGVVTAASEGTATITATSEGKSATVAIKVVAAAPAPTPLVIASTVGDRVYPTGDTESGGQGQTVDGIPCQTTLSEDYHIHVHVSLIVDGRQLAIPVAIGIQNPVFPEPAVRFAVGGTCVYPLHTHDETGIVHVEAAAPGDYKLGQVFDIWGQELSSTNVAGHEGLVTVFVDGKRYTDDPRNIVFEPHMQITLEVGNPVVPPTYTFPDGY
jgi:hypothetical protein